MQFTCFCCDFDLVAFSQAPRCTNFLHPGSASDSRTGEVRSTDGDEEVEEQEEGGKQVRQSLGKGNGRLDKEAKEGVRKGLNSKLPSAPPASELALSNLHDVGCRSDQQVCFIMHCHNGLVFCKYTFYFCIICFRQSVLRIG